MKKSKKFLSVLCAVCMMLSISAPAFAADSVIDLGIIQPRDVTDSSKHILNAASDHDTINWPGSTQYCYWKIAVQNNSSTKLRIYLYKDGTTDTLIRTMEVPGNQSKEFFVDTSDSNQILTDARYHLFIQSDGGSTNLNGIVWYKFATNASELT